mmetsp:Transcript_27254/g.59529  ORF Transcript_27254/g.59529 Transcript_27254/m.59529 type:complete len:338 (-) Transcript_27254:101-1114(-)|eukprot:CAMPEP_0118938222 /NCGR_PEP_ID=MMETSP1169-20130426/25178_1 /TAXON_ID=36882 /ORGANISM="Pyramimonas obovata, Strain CCMP722" /LENGTH=337 /DNA_ID=CAMNT_0006882105 /DNA_START=21 /DNA_END=1034 /DNA_ORIENTATION=-
MICLRASEAQQGGPKAPIAFEMSRTASLKEVFLSDGVSLKCLKPTGDCFYEAFVEAYSTSQLDIEQVLRARNSGSECEEPTTSKEDQRGSVPVAEGISVVATLRKAVASCTTSETFEMFQMYWTAGLDDYGFMRRCRDVESLKSRMCVCGKDSGAGTCIWANEFEISTLSRLLRVAVLVLDMQAKSHSRYIAIGICDNQAAPEPGEESPSHVVVLQRTRRQHYNLILFEGRGLLALNEVPARVRDLWRIPAQLFTPTCIEEEHESEAPPASTTTNNEEQAPLEVTESRGVKRKGTAEGDDEVIEKPVADYPVGEGWSEDEDDDGIFADEGAYDRPWH